MLTALYERQMYVRLDQSCNNRQLCHVLHHTPSHEQIMLLGHGSDKGLFSREDDSINTFDRIIVGHPHTYYLRRHGSNTIGIWCNANLFAAAEGLHGLFSGMIITEISEATIYGIETTKEELDRENVKLATRLRFLLDEAVPLDRIPQRIATFDDTHSPLTEFNYQNFFYL